MRKAIDFTVRCTDPERKGHPAKYKIAAEWTGGGFTELKTFGFADDECLERVYGEALRRASAIKLVEGEILGDMRIYQLDTLRHDYELARAPELEEKMKAKFDAVVEA